MVNRRTLLQAGAGAMLAGGTARPVQSSAFPQVGVSAPGQSRVLSNGEVSTTTDLSVEPPGIQRHFATVNGRQVHYRRAGSGPPLVMMHQSVSSSAELVDAMSYFSPRFTVIAPDTPGYGLSDPLPIAHPELSDFAAALAEFLDVLDIQSTGVYGFHTGAMVAAEFGYMFPERTSVALLDGYVVFTDEERDDYLEHYFVDVPPQPDGSHLAWYWYRIRDQFTFSPWYRRTYESRVSYDLPDPARIHLSVMRMLQATDTGTPAYAAAFRYPSKQRAMAFTAPTWLLNFSLDGIRHHPERLPGMSAAVRREMLPQREDVYARITELLDRYADAAGSPAASIDDHSLPRSFVSTRYMQIAMQNSGSGSASMLLLHAPGRSSAQWSSLPDSWRQRWRLHAPDLPGHGGSLMAGTLSSAVLVDILEDIVDALPGDPLVLAVDESGALALALQGRRPGLRVIAVDLPAPDARPRMLPDLVPRADGGHLLSAWLAARDTELYHPWHEPLRENRLGGPFQIEANQTHARTVDLLLAAQNMAQFIGAIQEIDTRALLQRKPELLELVARADKGLERDVQEAASIAGLEPRRWSSVSKHWDPPTP